MVLTIFQAVTPLPLQKISLALPTIFFLSLGSDTEEEEEEKEISQRCEHF